MKRLTEQYWNQLAARHPAAVVQRYRPRLEGSGPFFERAPKEKAARDFLEELVAGGDLEADERSMCPQCDEDVDEQQVSEGRCRCGFSFEDEKPYLERVYYRQGRRSRDPLWVVTIHGMNTRGPWQEEFGWKLAQIYGYAVPVEIYKYGKLLISPLLLLSQESYARRLVDRLRKRRSEMQATDFGDRPDVIAHSFGTWLLARALQRDPHLQLGRVVLTGSVVPPDFNWRRFIESDPPQVEAVLCHYGGCDRVVPVAQFFVPSSGPSGRRGFNDQGSAQERVRHRFEPNFRHSDYFAPGHLDRVMREVWEPFLTLPDEDLATWGDSHGAQPAAPWRPSLFGLATHLFKYVVLALLAALVLVAAAALCLGFAEILRSLGILSGAANGARAPG